MIVRTNILNTIPESTLSNNLSASLDRTAIDAPALTLGSATSGTLSSGSIGLLQSDGGGAGQTLQVDFRQPDGDGA